jgi:phage tail-like protein
MAMDDLDGGVASAWSINVDGITTYLQKVEGLALKQKSIELKQNGEGGKYISRFLPGTPDPCEIKLTRAITKNDNFTQWVADSRLGDMKKARRNATISILDFQGEPLQSYNLKDVWPKELSITSMEAGGASVLSEQLTLVCAEVTAEK